MTTYPYWINFVGIICLIKQSATDYLVALPDGRSYYDPCTKTMLQTHLPFLIIPIGQVASSGVAGRIVSNCFIVEGFKSLNFAEAATQGTINDDDTVTKKNGYIWSEIDPLFQLDMNTPANTILTMPLRQGTFSARRLFDNTGMRDLAVFTEVQIDGVGGTIEITVDGSKKVTVVQGAQIVVANVEPLWIDDVKADSKTDFNLYYSMAIVPPVFGSCKAPIVKTPSMTTLTHPYLSADRGLQIACSSTTYP